MYLTFIEYQQLGGKLNEDEYLRAEYAARMKIDYMTGSMLRDEDPVREAVKMLVLELVERVYCGALDGKEKISVSNDGRSYSAESNKGKAEELIKEYLSGENIDGEPLITRGSIQFARVRRV